MIFILQRLRLGDGLESKEIYCQLRNLSPPKVGVIIEIYFDNVDFFRHLADQISTLE